MERKAQCQCGSLSLTAEGEPDIVMCSCKACQRRTGSAFGLGAYYPKDKVRISGAAKRFSRIAESGEAFVGYFCSDCGTTLYFESARHPSGWGISVGCFADPTMPAPVRSVWEQSRHRWLAVPAGIPRFLRGRDSERVS